MSYIGSTPTTQSFIAGTDAFNGTGSATNFTLSRFVNSVNDVQVVVNNVVQYPPNYSVSGNTLTISPAPSAGTNNVYVRYLSTTLQSITIPGGSSVVGNFGLSGNLQFLGSAQRITGDFSNATVANRVMFQTSTVNGNTGIEAIPNGTGTQALFLAASNPSDPGNSPSTFMGCNGFESQFVAHRRGTGTYLPMTFFTGGSEAMRIFVSRGVSIGNTTDPGAGNLRVTGSVLVNAVAGIGYATGAGGAVTQGAGSGKATTVTLDKPTGQITMNNANLNAGATVNFTCNCSQIAATDTVQINVAQSGAYTASNYRVFAYPTGGNFIIGVNNWSGGNLAEAIVLNYTILKGVAS